MKRFPLLFFVAQFIVIGIFALPIRKTDAVTSGIPFGGLVFTAIPCTCPPFGMAVTFEWAYTGAKLPTPASIYYAPGTPTYAYGLVGVPRSYELGSYIPGVSLCRLPDPAQVAAGDPDPCDPGIPVPTIGSMLYVGTSRPGLAI